MTGFDPVHAQEFEAEIEESLACLCGVSVVPSVASNPIAKLGAPVLAFDHETDRADQLARFCLDDRECCAGAVGPGGQVAFDPGRRCADRIRVRDVERGVRDLTHTREPLDVPRIVQLERSQGETVGSESRLVWHRDDSNTVLEELPERQLIARRGL